MPCDDSSSSRSTSQATIERSVMLGSARSTTVRMLARVVACASSPEAWRRARSRSTERRC